MVTLEFKHGYGHKNIPDNVLSNIRISLDNIIDQDRFNRTKDRVVSVDIQDYWIIFEYGNGSYIAYSTTRNNFDINEVTLSPGQLMTLSGAVYKLEEYLVLKQKLYEDRMTFVRRVRSIPKTFDNIEWKIEFDKIYNDYSVRPIVWENKVAE